MSEHQIPLNGVTAAMWEIEAILDRLDTHEFLETEKMFSQFIAYCQTKRLLKGQYPAEGNRQYLTCTRANPIVEQHYAVSLGGGMPAAVFSCAHCAEAWALAKHGTDFKIVKALRPEFLQDI